MLIKGKTALIPGASRPVGRAIARKLADEGCQLVLPYYDWPDSTSEMIEEFDARNTSYLAVEADLTSEDDITKLVAEVEKHYGVIDYLINNIERGGMPVVHGSYHHEHNKGQWNLEVTTTLKSKWLLFNSFLPLLKKGRDAAVVNISSIAGITGRSGPAELLFNDGYSAANRSVSTFTETWARESAPNIRVNELMLGLVRNRHGEGTRGWLSLSEKQKDLLYDNILLGRTGLPKEVAETVFFLLFHATYITGAILRCDGGYTLGGQKTSDIAGGIL